MQVARYVVAALVAMVVALGAGNEAGAQEQAVPWDYVAVQQGIDAQLSHPGRWRFKRVAEMARVTVVEGKKRRTGSRRYFVVTRRSTDVCDPPGTCVEPAPVLQLRIARVRGPIDTVIAVAVAVDDAE